jgi:hypothetical protein
MVSPGGFPNEITFLNKLALLLYFALLVQSSTVQEIMIFLEFSEFFPVLLAM